MDAILRQALHGVNLGQPGAFQQIVLNLLAQLPWAMLCWSTVVFVAIGALIGWRRGRIAAGIGWALLLGPIGWLLVWRLPPRSSQLPPPLPRWKS